MGSARRTIAIAGDVTVDWVFMNPGGGFECGSFAQPGGAAMLAAPVRELTRSDPALGGACKVTEPTVSPRALSSPGYRGLDRTWTSWSLPPRGLSDRSRYTCRSGGFWGHSCTDGGVGPRPQRRAQRKAVLNKMTAPHPSRASLSFLVERLGSTDLTAVACAIAFGGRSRSRRVSRRRCCSPLDGRLFGDLVERGP